MPEEEKKVDHGDAETRKKVALQAGLSPTVEKMFGALVDPSDAAEEDKSAVVDAGRASRSHSR